MIQHSPFLGEPRVWLRDVVRPALLRGAQLSDFRREFAGASFDIVSAAADPKSGHALGSSNIFARGGGAFAHLLTETRRVTRAIIVARANRQLIPLLEDVMLTYERLLDRLQL